MTFNEISEIRLLNQQVINSRFNSPQELVSYMGAMQAQDYNMSQWAVGVRLQDLTVKQVEEAMNKGEIIRTHVLRPTWHLVSSTDIYWMLELTASRIKATAKSRWKELGLDEVTFKKSNAVIEKALRDGKHLNRDEIRIELERTIPIFDQRLSHLMFRAELDGLVCSGSINEKKQTYALLEERVPNSKIINREDALVELAKKYFRSHGPATLQDFVWWSGLSVTNAKKGMEMIRGEFIAEKIDEQVYWFPDSSHGTVNGGNPEEVVQLLPAYDEFIISYKDRSASIPFTEQKKTISNNGLFRPVIVLNGQVAGTWKRTVKKDKVIIETDFFKTPHYSTKHLVEKAAIRFGDFFNVKTEVK
jgi:hypothetical protein